MPLELTITERGGPSRTQVVPKEMAFIGRREDNDIVLPFAFISSRHGRIFRRNGGLFVEDMGSTNGILVNGDPIPPMAPRALRPADVLQIEKISIQARWVEATYAEEPPGGSTFHESLEALPAVPVPAPVTTRTPPRMEAPSTLFEMQATGGASAPVEPPAEATAGAVRLGQASLPDVLASARYVSRLRAEQTDEFGVWVVVFKALGLLAIFGCLILFVLVMFA